MLRTITKKNDIFMLPWSKQHLQFYINWDRLLLISHLRNLPMHYPQDNCKILTVNYW